MKLKKQQRRGGVKLWNGICGPLMRLGTYSSQHSHSVRGAPRELLAAAEDYCQTRIADFATRSRIGRRRRKNAIAYYAKWLGHIQKALGKEAS